MESSLEASKLLEKFQLMFEKVENANVEGGELDHLCSELKTLVAAQKPPKSIIENISKCLSLNVRLIVRSSVNVEDLAGMSGVGLYDSIPNIKASNPEVLANVVAHVWASVYHRRVVLSRRIAGVPQRQASMVALVQEMLSPQLSFVLHTISTIDQDDKVVQAKKAVGLGETLASSTRGTPWRLAANKLDGKVKTLAFTNFSEELVVIASGPADGKVMGLFVGCMLMAASFQPFGECQVAFF